MSPLRLLFALGILLMAGAWMIDRVAAFPWLLRWITPSDAAARDALDLLTRPSAL